MLYDIVRGRESCENKWYEGREGVCVVWRGDRRVEKMGQTRVNVR